MPQPVVSPYGSWKSPISTELITSGGVGLSYPSQAAGAVYWVEARPSEKGRQVLVRRAPTGAITDLTPPPFNVRTRVHEYGGLSYVVDPTSGTVFFANFDDQRVYGISPEGGIAAITPETASQVRYADFRLDAPRSRLICVREDHRASGGDPALVVNQLAAVDLKGSGDDVVLSSGRDFYAAPALSPDGSKLAWLEWDHPNMPWDGTDLMLADVTPGGALANARRAAGGPSESIFQPAWGPDGNLYFVSDRSNWWNLYRLGANGPTPLYPLEAEFGLPLWQFGMTTYGFDAQGCLVTVYTQGGQMRLAKLDIKANSFDDIELPYTFFAMPVVEGSTLLAVAGSPVKFLELVRVDLKSGQVEVLRQSTSAKVDEGYLSPAQRVEFPTEHGKTAFANYYPPRNRDFQAPSGDLPPLLVKSHGGPTSTASTVLNLSIQYWTSRGFAVLDVDYGGSTGNGREYRERLNGQWGVVDVDDCVNGALYLAQRGLADPNRMAITGGSAGGYTTLAALTFRDAFSAGASHYGIGDLMALARDTHKFELRYTDRLVGPLPEAEALYRERSPINHVHRLNRPIILLQGLEDKVVPPNQAETMFEAVRARELPVAYLPFEGEQHGFRQAKNIQRALEAEFYFYSRIFGFEPADPIEPVHIENL